MQVNHLAKPKESNFSELCCVNLPFPASTIFDRASHAFDETALSVFRFQYANNVLYRKFADSFSKNPETVINIHHIPFLPVEFFKTHNVYCAQSDPQITFTSSGTTGMVTSKHPVADINLYKQSFLRGFTEAYGNPSDYIFLFLLPSYLEREGSSLVYMAEELKRVSASNESQFYLHDYSRLAEQLTQLKNNSHGKKVMILGVTYALLDLAEQFPQHIPDFIIAETGGMKGKRKEITRDELHRTLTQAFGVTNIHSEYGMTELLSQAWSKGDGIFNCPPWMKIITRETNDPLTLTANGKTGGVNIIDLANVYSCSFISTSDLGKVHADGSFEILGRFDFSDTRGCNLLAE